MPKQDIRNLWLIFFACCAVYGSAVALQPSATDNQAWLEQAKHGSILDPPMDRCVLRPIPIAVLKLRLPLMRIDQDTLYFFNVVLWAGCCGLFYLLLRQFNLCANAAVLMSLFLMTDFRVRQLIDFIGTSSSFAFFFGFAGILVLVRNPGAWIQAGILFFCAVFSRDNAYAFALPLIALCSKRKYLAAICVGTMLAYFVCRWYMDVGSIWNYSDRIDFPRGTGVRCYGELTTVELILMFMRNAVGGIVASFIPQLVEYDGWLSFAGFWTKQGLGVGIIETAVMLFLCVRGACLIGYRDTIKTGLLIAICGAIAQTFYYCPTNGIYGYAGFLLLACAGLQRSSVKWDWILWFVLSYRTVIVVKYLAIYIQERAV